MVDIPIIANKQHPIETGNYCLSTNAIMELYAVITKWISNRVPGGIIYGRPRLGKTRAITSIEKYLKENFDEKLPIFKVYCCQHKPNENRFFGDILHDIGHSGYSMGKADAKKERLIKYFIEKAQISGTHKIVMFIDEAQMLYVEDYNWLVDIYNQLDRFSINLTVILVGQEELIYQKDAFLNSEKMQIVGRFMVHTFRFSGIKTLGDMVVCLQGYDEKSEYPPNSKISYTQYYFTDAFEDGHRLYKDAKIIFDIFKKLRDKAKIIGELEIPMQYITLAIDNCLKNIGRNGKNKYWPTPEDWEESILYSGFVEAEISNSLFNGGN